MARDYQWYHDEVTGTFDFLQNKYQLGHQRMKRNLQLDKDHGGHWKLISGLSGMEGENFLKSIGVASPADLVSVNYVGSYDRLMLSFLNYQDLKITAKPKTPENYVSARLQGEAMNYEWRHSRFGPEYDLALLDFVTTGNCWFKVGWNTVLDHSDNPKKHGELELRDIVEDSLSGLRCSSFMMAYDLSAPNKHPDTASWVCQGFYASKEWIANNDALNNKAIRKGIGGGDVKPTKLADTFYDHENDDWKTKAASELYFCFELWDKMYRKRFIFCHGVEDPLHEETPKQWDKSIENGGYCMEYPWIHARFIDLVNEWAGIGLPNWIESLQLQADRSETSLYDYVHRNLGGQFQGDSPGVDPEEVNKFLRGEKFIWKKPGTSGISAINQPSIPADQYRISAMTEQHMEKVTRLNEILAGLPAGSRVSATEFQGRANYSQMGINAIQRKADAMVEAIARQGIKHIKANYDRKRMIQIAGPLGSYWDKVPSVVDGKDGTFWVEFNRDNIQGEFDVEIQSSAAPKKDPIQEVQELNSFTQLLFAAAKFAAAGADLTNIGGINLYEALRATGEAMDMKNLPRILTGAQVVEKPIMELLGINIPQIIQFRPGAGAATANSTGISEALGSMAGSQGGNG